MSGKNNEGKTDNKKVFAIVAVFLCFVIIVAAMMYYQTTKRDQKSSPDQTNDQTTQGKQKTRREYTVKVSTSDSHFGVVFVSEEDNNVVCEIEFENDDEATVTNEYKINAGVGDTVTVEVQFGGYVTVRLLKEGLIFSETIASKTDYDGIILRYTIKEDDI